MTPDKLKEPTMDEITREQVDLLRRAIKICVEKAGDWDSTWEAELNQLCDLALRALALRTLCQSQAAEIEILKYELLSAQTGVEHGR